MFRYFFAAAAAGDGFTVTITRDWLIGIAGAAVAALLVALSKWIWPKIREHFGAVYRLRKAERALAVNSPGLWIAPSFPPQSPEKFRQKIEKSIPIIVVANLKGGVGKTTTVANLIGHYSAKKHKRVLAIDLDFQGSLSRVALSDADHKRSLEEQAYGNESKAARLIEGQSPEWILNVSEPVFNTRNARCIPSYYTLSIMENRVLFEWLISKRREDIRYNLARVLHDDKIQEGFDIILIDAPPRLTTGCIQALCAATHVLIPTVLDGLSAEASGGFVDQLTTNQKLWPYLRLLGVFGNMTDKLTVDDRDLEVYEQDAVAAAADAVKAALDNASPILRAAMGDPLFPQSCFIPDKAELSKRAGERIAYLSTGGTPATQQLSRAFDRLGDEIDRRILATSRVNIAVNQ